MSGYSFQKNGTGNRRNLCKNAEQQLKELETNLLITRTVKDENQLMVFYAITDYGKSVTPLTENLVEWGLKHRKKIIEG